MLDPKKTRHSHKTLRLPNTRLILKQQLSSINRIVAVILSVVWATAAVAALVVAYVSGRWVVLLAALSALCYAVLWLRVVVQGRLLTWREVSTPWRAR